MKMSLYKYELYKVFSRKSIYLCLAIFVALYVITSFSAVANPVFEDDNLYEPWKGEVTPAKVLMADKALQEIYKIQEKRARSLVSDEETLVEPTEFERRQSQVYQDILNAGQRLSKRSEEIAKLTREVEALKSRKPDGFELRKKQLHLDMLNNLEPPKIYFIKGWIQIIDFINTYGLIFIGGLLLLGISPVFADEYSANMHELILSSKHGKQSVVTAKIFAGITYAVSIALFLEFINVAANYYSYGLSGSNSPLQAIFKYARSPFALNLGEYHVAQLSTHIFGTVAFALFVLLLSVVCRNALTAIFLAGATFSVPVILKSFLYVTTGWPTLLIDYSYTQVIKAEGLYFNFKAINVLGTPIQYYTLLLSLICLVSLAITTQIYRAFRTSS